MARAGVTSNKNSRFIVLASICVVVAALYFAQEVLIPVSLAVLFSFLLGPLVRMLERRKLGRVPSVTIVVVIALAITVGLGWITTVQVLNLARRLPEYKGEILYKVQNVKARFGSEGGLVEKVKDVAEDVERAGNNPKGAPAAQRDTKAPDASSPAAVGTVKDNPIWVAVTEPSGPIGQMGGILGRVLSPLGTAGLVLILVIFMLLQREDLRDRMIRLIGQGQIHITTTALDDAATRISRYLTAQAIVNGTYGITIGIGLWAIGYFVGDKGFPSFVLWGLLCAVLRFIPYVGPWIASAFPLTLALAVYHGFNVFFAVIALFVVIELLSNNLMEPMLYGASTGMSTVAILVSAVFWTWLWGATGLVLATPLTVCLVVIGKYVPQLQFLDILLGDEPVLEPPERVYQRLLALDSEEAAELAQAHLRESGSLERVYDDVLLPALAMAEQDRHKGKLDEERQQFINQSMRDMIEELGDAARLLDEQRAGADVKEAAAANVAIAKGQTPPPTTPAAPAPANANGNGNGKPTSNALVQVSGAAMVGASVAPQPNAPIPGERPTLPKGCSINVVCLPARDEGDDIANAMLVQLLGLRGYCAYGIPVAALASEMVEAVEKRQAHVVVVSALPPGAVSYSRYLCKRVHARYPEMLMAVGLWTLKGDLNKAKERITCAAAVQITTTLGGMLDQIHQMAQPVILRGEPADASAQAETNAPSASPAR